MNTTTGASNRIGRTADYWSKDVTACVKGYLAICVLVHHLYLFSGYFSNTYFGHFLNYLGEWSVAIFLFISGYGLYFSYMQKGRDYLKGFLRKRFLPLYLEYIFFVLVYTVLIVEEPTVLKIVKSLFWGGTVVSFGWFFQQIFVLYLIYYVAFRYHQKNKAIPVYLILTALFFFFCAKTGQNYYTFIPFSLGMLYAARSEYMDRIVSKWYLLITAISFVCFFTFYLLYVYSLVMAKFSINAYLWIVLTLTARIAIIIFSVMICYLATKYGWKVIVNPVSRFLSKYSLEIYLCQGIVLYYAMVAFGASPVFLIVGFFGSVLLAILVRESICLLSKLVKHKEK